MKRNFKKMLVVLLTIAMLLSNMNLQAFAAETEGEEATETVVEQVQEQPSVEEEQADEEKNYSSGFFGRFYNDLRAHTTRDNA